MNEKMKWIVFAIIIVAVLIMANKLFAGAEDGLHAFGIGSSKDADELSVSKVITPSFYKTLTGTLKLLPYATLKEMAKNIYDARTLKVYTNDSAIIGVFKQCKNKAQVSQLSEMFQTLYKEDLVGYFSEDMTDKNKVILFKFVGSLPKK